MTRLTRSLSAMGMAVVVALLAGCVGIPRSGPVSAGPPFGEATPGDVVFNPLDPEPGATPEGILQGFIDAFTGAQGDYAVARKFLTHAEQSVWEPRKSVLVRAGAESYRAIDADTIEYSFTTRAQVDESGAYQLTPLAPQTQTFKFAIENGEWRISEAPPGIVLSESTFHTLFRPHALYFYDLSLQHLVPDQRWFLGGTTATRIVTALLAGPPEWLQGAAVSQFPDGTALSPGTTVTIEATVAHVDLTTEAAAANARQRQLMRLQLSESLKSVSGIGTVEVSVAGTPLTTEPLGSDAPVAEPRVDPRPLVLVDNQFGYVVGDTITPIEGLSERIVGLQPQAVTVGVLGNSAAVLAGDGRVFVVRAGQAPVRPVDSRPGLIAPSLDDYGYAWSVPAAEPDALTVFDFDGNAHAIENAPGGAGVVRSINVSRDGARIAILLQTASGPRLIVAAIIRDPDRGWVPTALGTPILDTPLDSADEGIDATWMDELSVATLALDEAGYVATLHSVGGGPTALGRPPASTAIIGGNGRTGLRVLGVDGVLSAPRGSGWQRTTLAVQLIATQR